MSRMLTRVLILALLFAPAVQARAEKKADKKDNKAKTAAAPTMAETLLDALEWREVGPYRGGRSAAVAGITQDRQTYYMGATGGGVWKTADGGGSWQPVSDGFFGGSIGAVAVSSWDPNVVYVGGGESTVRGNVSHGDGIWKSTDAGTSWHHIGLGDSRHVPRIRIHPRDPDLVYVAALGHLFGPNEQRGIFRSTDGGTNWQKIHYVSEHAGAIDLAMDPNNPRILYAAFWRVLRTPWSLESGGEGSTLWKSTDGGDTWHELTSKPGLPKGTLGKMGISVSPTNSQNVYAIIEAEEGGVFRSKDGGDTWQRTNEERNLRQRAWYYTRIYADPADEEGVYVTNVRFHHSKDGGKTFRQVGTPHGDNHDLWIDPKDPLRMIEGNDGGVNVSFDGGDTWSTQTNQPTAQMYRVTTDNSFPYRLLGGQQDNSSVRIRSRSAFGGAIGLRDWEASAGCECGHMAPKPDDPDLVFGGCYGGNIERLNHRTGESRDSSVWPDDPMGWGAGDLKYRFQWNFPIFFSPHDPNRLYTAAQVLFVSEDLGHSWQTISPDLSRNDPEKLGPSGGPITKDNTSVEYYSTIFAAIESPHEPGVLWAGTDDGRLHISRDDEWTEVTPPGLPEWAQVNSIEAHPTAKGGLYVAATAYKSDDFRPYLFKTTDYGTSWKTIVDGIDEQHFTRVIRADPDRAGLLYAGTERGVYVSFDDGAQWQPLQGNLPIVPITDLAVKEQDLIAATQGRGFWILDDLSPLHQMPEAPSANEHHLFAPRPSYRLAGGGFFRGAPANAGKNPPNGVVFHYFLAQEPAKEDEAEKDGAEEGDVKLEILDAAGEIIRTFEPKPAAGEKKGPPRGFGANNRVLDVSEGAHQFVWNMRYSGIDEFPGMVIWNRFTPGPKAVPGHFRARLTVGEWHSEVPFEIVADPRSTATAEQRQEQLDFLLALRDRVNDVHEQIGRIREARGQIESLEKRLGDGEGDKAVRTAAKELKESMEAVEKELYQTKNRSAQDPLNFPIRLNDKLSGLFGSASRGDFHPTASIRAVHAELIAAADAELQKLDKIWAEDLPAFNQLVRDSDVTAVSFKPKDEGKKDPAKEAAEAE